MNTAWKTIRHNYSWYILRLKIHWNNLFYCNNFTVILPIPQIIYIWECLIYSQILVWRFHTHLLSRYAQTMLEAQPFVGVSYSLSIWFCYILISCTNFSCWVKSNFWTWTRARLIHDVWYSMLDWHLHYLRSKYLVLGIGISVIKSHSCWELEGYEL